MLQNKRHNFGILAIVSLAHSLMNLLYILLNANINSSLY